ncbi:DUF4832 domain-containing protein [Clostridia bacterium]|nr:DUF4832 domain-containing protein [Clostridia bacterium]
MAKENVTAPSPSPESGTIWADVIHVNLPWHLIMPSGTITRNSSTGKYTITGNIDTNYIEGTGTWANNSDSPALKFWRDKKKVTAVIRVVLEDPDELPAKELPDWLTNGINALDGANAAGFSYTPKPGIGSFQPKYDNTGLIVAHEYLIKKLAEIYNDDPFISFVQMGSIGHWGEWNYAGTSSSNSQLYVANAALADKYMRPYIKYFSKKPFMMRYAHELGQKYGTGLYHDAVGNQELTTDFLTKSNDSHAYNLGNAGALREQQPAMPYYWRNGAVTGEFATPIDGSGDWSYWLNSSSRFTSTLEQIKSMHMSFVKFNFNERGKGTTVKGYMTQILQTMGARLWVKAINAGTTIHKSVASEQNIILTWRNGNDANGTAPFYFDWDVVVRLTTTSGTVVYTKTTNPAISRCMPGQDYYQNVALDLTSVPNGTYKIEVGIPSPYGTDGFLNKTMLRLANSSTSDNTWFTVKSSVTITN